MKQLTNTLIRVNNCYPAESIEEQMRRATTNGEKLDASAPLIYTARKDGVVPAYDIRTDRFEIAMLAADKVNRSRIAKREEIDNLKEPTQKVDNTPKEERA